MKGTRFWLISLYAAACLAGAGAGGAEQLTQVDVEQIIAQAATRAAQVDQNAIIAVVDREGYVLAVWDVAGNPSPNIEFISGAIARAGTAAFLSSNQNAFTSRTAGFIIQQHFPPGVRNTPPGPLVGVGISSVYLAPDKLVTAGINLKTKKVAIKVDSYAHSDVNFIKQIPLSMTGAFDPNGPLFEKINPFAPGAIFPELPGAQSPGTFGVGTYTGTNSLFLVTGTTAASAVAAASAAEAAGSSPEGSVVPGLGAVGTSLNDAPGGVPLYKNGVLVGGVGVTGAGMPINVSTGFAIIQGALPMSAIDKLSVGVGLGPIEPPGLPKNQKNATPGFNAGPDTDEDVALAGQTGYAPSHDILATNDHLGGIQIPYVDTSTNLNGVKPFGSVGVMVAGYPPQKSPPEFNYPAAVFGGVAGELRFPIRNDPSGGNIDGESRLTADEVSKIISKSAARSAITRAGIRLPLGVPARVFISVVGDPGDTGKPPPILGVFRTGEATVFSWDVAVQKARTAFLFSNHDVAMSSRAVGFLAQRYYPPGIDGNQPGPFFGVQEALLIDGFLDFFQREKVTRPYVSLANPYLPNQITIFPGGFPLYRNGVLIGAIGVSGDGVDQDDIVSASGCADFLPPVHIRADQFVFRGARLPYAKFPRDPGP